MPSQIGHEGRERHIVALGQQFGYAAHIAKVARMRYPNHAVPEALQSNFQLMSKLAADMVHIAGGTLADRNVLDAEKMADDDEEMDSLRTLQFKELQDGRWTHGIEAAVDCALLGRYYERIADHAVLLGSRVIYVVTGMQPEGDNWTIA